MSKPYNIAIQNIRKYFTYIGFDTYNELKSFDSNVDDPSHYEIIEGRQCLYFDFDGDVNLELLTKLIVDWFNKYNSSIIINVYTSSDNELAKNTKISYHVIVKGVSFENHIVCGKVACEIAETLGESFDRSVYTSKRNLRMLRSRKVDSTRVKRFLRTTYRSTNYKSRYEDDPLYMSLVCCSYDSPLLNIKYDKSVIYENIATLTTEDKNHMLDVVSNVLPGVFDKRDVKGSSIFLNRKKPAECPVCLRIHQNDNAVISLRNGKVYFTCFRDASNPMCLEGDDELLDAEIILDKKEAEQVLSRPTIPIDSVKEFAKNICKQYPLKTNLRFDFM